MFRITLCLTLNTGLGETPAAWVAKSNLTTTKLGGIGSVLQRANRRTTCYNDQISKCELGRIASVNPVDVRKLFQIGATTAVRGCCWKASLPRTVLALPVSTRAKLAGRIVRDEDLLDGSEIRIGLRSEVIVRELQKFLIRTES